jgi:DNA-binding beta-propeller fold protein YncE
LRHCAWKFLSLFFAALIATLAAGCEDLVEQREDLPTLHVNDDDDRDVNKPWEYPYYLVIGGGYSETLSLLTVSGPGEFSLTNDVQLTGSGINDTVVRGGELYAVCSLTNSVVVYDTQNLSIKREVSVGESQNPMALAFYENKRAYLANYVSNAITYHDLADDDGGALAVIAMPSGDDLPRDAGVEETWARPNDVVVTGNRVYATLGNLQGLHMAGGPGLVAVVDAPSQSLVKSIELTGRDTVGMHLDEDAGLLYAVSAGEFDDTWFIGNGVVEIIDLASEKITDTVHLNGSPFEMVIAAGGTAFCNNGKEGVILSFDTKTLEVLDPIDIRDPGDELSLSFASALAVDGNGYLYAAEFNHDKLFVIDTHNGNDIIAVFVVNDGPDTLSFIR